MPCFSKTGNVTNNAKEGITSQNTLAESALTLETSLVSIYSQIIASTETKGIDASIAPTKELRFAISEITTIKTVVIMIFTR